VCVCLKQVSNKQPLGSQSLRITLRIAAPLCSFLIRRVQWARPIDELNEGLQTFRSELVGDSLAAKRVEVAIVTFGPVQVQTDFTTIQNFIAPHLSSMGDTPMGAAVERAIEMVRERKDIYKSNGIPYYRPWVFLMTDGAPTDSIARASQLVREGEASK
jgi:uncharacterized protein YegL